MADLWILPWDWAIQMSSVKWRRVKMRTMTFRRISLHLSRVCHHPAPDLSVLYSVHRRLNLNTWTCSKSQASDPCVGLHTITVQYGCMAVLVRVLLPNRQGPEGSLYMAVCRMEP